MKRLIGPDSATGTLVFSLSQRLAEPFPGFAYFSAAYVGARLAPSLSISIPPSAASPTLRPSPIEGEGVTDRWLIRFLGLREARIRAPDPQVPATARRPPAKGTQPPISKSREYIA
jgi:hypothetical protein